MRAVSFVVTAVCDTAASTMGVAATSNSSVADDDPSAA